jgi:hypothetical protein
MFSSLTAERTTVALTSSSAGFPPSHILTTPKMFTRNKLLQTVIIELQHWKLPHYKKLHAMYLCLLAIFCPTNIVINNKNK